MSDWHNEVMADLGWFTSVQEASVDDHGTPIPAVMQVIINKLVPESGKMEEESPFAGMPLCKHKIQFDCDQCKFEKEVSTRPGQCQYCGTRTGQHGFSFDMERQW